MTTNPTTAQGAWMSIDKLTKLVPPPKKPTEVGTLKQWAAFEKELGTELPEDYRDFVFRYGSGLFASLFRVYNPFAASEFIALLPSVKQICDIARDAQEYSERDYPYPIFPKPGGILPWGNDENGNDYYWLMKGPTSKWTVVVGFHGFGCKPFKYTMTEFLLATVSNKVKRVGEFQAEELVFSPFKPSAEKRPQL